MANAEVLLLKPIKGLGAEGDRVRVRAGFARNYLLPSNIALPVNLANAKQMEALKKARVAREMAEKETYVRLAEQLAQVNVVIAVKTGENGRLFGSVTSGQIIEKLAEQGLHVEKKALHHAILKSLGKHDVEVRLHHDVVTSIAVEVVSENPVAEKHDETVWKTDAKKGKKRVRSVVAE